MPWFKVDDSYWSHPKVLLSLPEVRGVWITAGSWCAQHLTDGRIPMGVLRRLIPLSDKRVDALAYELEAAGLWYLDGDEWVFHDWFDYQPTREQVQKEREASAIRQRQWRERKRAEKAAQTKRNGVGNGVSNGVSNAAPTRPDPTRPSNYVDEALQASSRSHPGDGGAAPCEHGATHPRLCALCRRKEPTHEL